MRNHFYPLDVLRFFAAFAVMTFHLCFYAWAASNLAAHPALGSARYEALAPFTWFGWVGVEVFFVISGFVIANSAFGQAPISFLKNRVLRLYPAVWICATISLIAWLTWSTIDQHEILVRYLRSMVLWVRGPWIEGVYWSLAVEIVFYALVFWVLVASRIVRFTAIPWLLTTLSTLYSIPHTAPAFFEHELGAALLGKIEWYSGLTLMRYGAFFAIGIWLWLLNRGAMTPLRYAGMALAIGLGMFEIVWRAEGAPWEFAAHMAYPIWAPVLFWLCGVGLIAAVALAPHVFEVRSQLGQRILRRIGLMTYPLFLVHAGVGTALVGLLTGAGLDRWTTLAIVVAAMLALSYVVCAVLEAGLRKLLRGVLDAGERLLKRLVPRFDALFVGKPDAPLTP